MADGEDSKRWLIDELTALRRSVSEIQDQLGGFAEEPSDEFSSGGEQLGGIPADSVGPSPDAPKSLEMYRSFFEHSPVALWCHDSSELKAYVDALKVSGIADLRAYFKDHPEGLAQSARKIRFVDANAAALKLFRAQSKETFFADFARVFGERARNCLVQFLTGIADGKVSGQRQVMLHALDGGEVYAWLRWCAVPGHEESLKMVLVSAIDLAAPRAGEPG
ncbi:MAG: PAS domain-containing protein [Desulfomonile tiedjei]|nr:PAS domain-containing protein [Desulfomonile tiedjei]